MTASASVAVPTLVIWDAVGEPLPGQGDVYCWSGRVEHGSVHSLLTYVEAHGERLRTKYLGWVHDLGDVLVAGRRVVDHLEMEAGFSYWWMTLLAEKSAYKSRITDALRLLALEEIITRRRPERVELVSADNQLHAALSQFCRDLGVQFHWTSGVPEAGPAPGRAPWHRRLPIRARALGSLLQHVRRHWRFRQVPRPSWRGGDRAILLCSYFNNVDGAAAENGVFKSSYWTGLPSALLKSGYRLNWLHLFIRSDNVPSARRALWWTERFNRRASSDEFHAFLHTYLSARVIGRVLGRWLWLNGKAVRLRHLGLDVTHGSARLSLWPVMREDWRESMLGSAAIQNLLHWALFDAALADLPRMPTGLYLCENQGWERALIHAWRKHGHERLIGVAHSTVRFWDLRYWSDTRTLEARGPNRLPQPDVVAVNGKAAAEEFLRAGFPAGAVAHCEALRYGYLGRCSGSDRPAPDPRQILVVGDIMAQSTARLLELLESALLVMSGTRIAIKPHPNCPVDVGAYPALAMSVVTEPLESLFREYRVVFTTNGTSAGVEAYCAGVSVIVMVDERELNTSALRGRPGVRFVSSDHELASALEAAAGDTAGAGDPHEFFFLDPDLSRWARLLEPIS